MKLICYDLKRVFGKWKLILVLQLRYPMHHAWIGQLRWLITCWTVLNHLWSMINKWAAERMRKALVGWEKSGLLWTGLERSCDPHVSIAVVSWIEIELLVALVCGAMDNLTIVPMSNLPRERFRSDCRAVNGFITGFDPWNWLWIMTPFFEYIWANDSICPASTHFLPTYSTIYWVKTGHSPFAPDVNLAGGSTKMDGNHWEDGKIALTLVWLWKKEAAPSLNLSLHVHGYCKIIIMVWVWDESSLTLRPSIMKFWYWP